MQVDDDDFDDDYTDNYRGDDDGDGNDGGTNDDDNAGTTDADDEPGYRGDDDDDDTTGGDNDTSTGTGDNDPLTDLFEVLGFTDGLITLDDEQRPFASLDSEERRNVLTQALDAEYQRGLSEANPEKGLDEQEIALVNHFRTHGTLEGFDMSSGLEGLSADELHRRDIVANDPEASEEEIDAELAARKGLTNFERRANKIRDGLEAQGMAQRSAAQDRQAREYTTTITAAVADIKDIEGFPLEAAEHDFIRRELTVAGEDGVAPFFRDLADPKNQARLAYLNRMFPAIVKGFEDQVKEAFEEGKRVALGKGGKRPAAQQGAAPAGNRQQQQRRQQVADDDVIGDYGHRR